MSLLEVVTNSFTLYDPSSSPPLGTLIIKFVTTIIKPPTITIGWIDSSMEIGTCKPTYASSFLSWTCQTM